MTEHRHGALVTATEKHHVFKPILVRITSTDKNIYSAIAAQHPQIQVPNVQVHSLTLVKLSVGVNSYLEVRNDAVRTNTSKQLIEKKVTRYYHGGETEEQFHIAKVDTITGEIETAVPNDFVLEVTLMSR